MPAQNVAIEPPVGIAALPDRLVIRAFLSAPFVAHGSLHAACRRLKSILRSDAFRDQRLESGWAERGVVLAGGRRAFGAVAECCMLCKSRWRPVAPMRGPRSDACSVVIDNEMWVMGGVDDGDRTLATVEVYSPKTNSWRPCTPMSQRRRNAVAGVVGGRLVVAGGFCDGHGHLTSAEAYTGTGWTPLPPMPHVADMATACVLNGRLYVVGGAGSSTVQVLGPASAGSSTVQHVMGERGPAPPLRPPRPDNPVGRELLFLTAETAETNGFRVAATAAQQHPFGAAVAAASRAPAFSTVAWSCKADLPAARDEAACVAHEGRVWVLGGCVDHRVSASVIVYGAEADAWDPDAVPALPSPCRGCQAATVDGEVLLCHQGRVVAHGAGPGWRDLGAAGAAGATRQVLGSLLLG